MFNYAPYLRAALELNVDRIREIQKDERGMTTETVIIMGVCAIIAAVVGAILLSSLRSAGNSTSDKIIAQNNAVTP